MTRDELTDMLTADFNPMIYQYLECDSGITRIENRVYWLNPKFSQYDASTEIFVDNQLYMWLVDIYEWLSTDLTTAIRRDSGYDTMITKYDNLMIAGKKFKANIVFSTFVNQFAEDLNVPEFVAASLAKLLKKEDITAISKSIMKGSEYLKQNFHAIVEYANPYRDRVVLVFMPFEVPQEMRTTQIIDNRDCNMGLYTYAKMIGDAMREYGYAHAEELKLVEIRRKYLYQIWNEVAAANMRADIQRMVDDLGPDFWKPVIEQFL